MREMTPFDTLCLHKCDTNMADSNRRQAVSHVSENQEFVLLNFKVDLPFQSMKFTLLYCVEWLIDYTSCKDGFTLSYYLQGGSS